MGGEGHALGVEAVVAGQYHVEDGRADAVELLAEEDGGEGAFLDVIARQARIGPGGALPEGRGEEAGMHGAEKDPAFSRMGLLIVDGLLVLDHEGFDPATDGQVSGFVAHVARGEDGEVEQSGRVAGRGLVAVREGPPLRLGEAHPEGEARGAEAVAIEIVGLGRHGIIVVAGPAAAPGSGTGAGGEKQGQEGK
jgi:hypothetical protein